MAVSWLPRVARWIERLMWLGGVMCLVVVFAIWRQAAVYQQDAKRQIQEIIATATPPAETGWSDRSRGPRRPDPLVGQLDIPRLRLSVAILEGDDEQTLRLAAGHLPGTPLPWEDGNSAVAGHRDTFFRPLKDLRVGDEVRLATRHGDFQYRVRRLTIVEPQDMWVLDPWEDVGLTLITCYPFRYVGAAPQRFIVQAERISHEE